MSKNSCLKRCFQILLPSNIPFSNLHAQPGGRSHKKSHYSPREAILMVMPFEEKNHFQIQFEPSNITSFKTSFKESASHFEQTNPLF